MDDAPGYWVERHLFHLNTQAQGRVDADKNRQSQREAEEKAQRATKDRW